MVRLWLGESRSTPEAVKAEKSGGASCGGKRSHLGGRRLESRGAAAHGREDRDSSVVLGWCPVLFCALPGRRRWLVPSPSVPRLLLLLERVALELAAQPSGRG